MKMTLLEMVQNILSAMDSDEVNSIGDTVESLQIAEGVRDAYFDLVSGLDLPEHVQLVHLDAYNDPERPNYLKVPSNVKKIKWIKYNNFTDGHDDYRDVAYLEPDEFLDRQFRITNYDYTQVITSGSLILPVWWNENPRFWTSFDDETIVFDGYNNTLDNTLQSSKSLCLAVIEPDFNMEDDFIPKLDGNLFPTLLAEAKSSAFINHKQVSNSKEEQRAKRGRVRFQNDLWRADQRKPYNRLPDYGRSPASRRTKIRKPTY